MQFYQAFLWITALVGLVLTNIYTQTVLTSKENFKDGFMAAVEGYTTGVTPHLKYLSSDVFLLFCLFTCFEFHECARKNLSYRWLYVFMGTMMALALSAPIFVAKVLSTSTVTDRVASYKTNLLHTIFEAGIWVWLSSNTWSYYTIVAPLDTTYLLTLAAFVPLLFNRDTNKKGEQANVRALYGLYAGLGFAVFIYTRFDAWAAFQRLPSNMSLLDFAFDTFWGENMRKFITVDFAGTFVAVITFILLDTTAQIGRLTRFLYVLIAFMSAPVGFALFLIQREDGVDAVLDKQAKTDRKLL